MNRPRWILPAIVMSQFAGTSLWFAGNAVLPDIQNEWHLAGSSMGWMTSSVQFGFIAGTFVFAFLSLADRFSPRLIFLICSILGGLSNILILFLDGSMTGLLLLRGSTGFFLAGIYPVGMKIAADWYREGLGKALGYLVGALVLGTAFPHLIRGLFEELNWTNVLFYVSLIAIIGGVVIFVFVKDGPFRKKSHGFEITALKQIFRVKEFRAASFGYFGHMWELYAFWTFVPFVISKYVEINQSTINISLVSFFIIGAGALGCIIGGYLSRKNGSAKVAFLLLIISGICCVLSPILFSVSTPILLIITVVWGFAVVGDSPQFSTLNALTAPDHLIGTGLTIVTSIGFGISIVSIEILNYSKEIMPSAYIFLLLIPGPIFGLVSMKPLIKKVTVQ